MQLEWLPGTDCTGPEYTFQGLSRGGNSLKIPIGDDEFVWIEYRSDYGFDSHLPGNGLLVMHKDHAQQVRSAASAFEDESV